MWCPTSQLVRALAFPLASSSIACNRFQSWFGVVFNLASGLGLTFSVTAQHRFKTRARVLVPSACVRLILLSFSVQVPLVLSLLLFLVTTIIVLVPPSAMPGLGLNALLRHHSASRAAESLFATTTTTLAVIGFANAIQQGSFFGIVGMLPARYMGSMMKGFGLAGLVVSAAHESRRTNAAQLCCGGADVRCQCDHGRGKQLVERGHLPGGLRLAQMERVCLLPVHGPHVPPVVAAVRSKTSAALRCLRI